ncbi:MAG: UDP-N-acetylmuramoyl-L-alanyl-D-glutamate--2,6-diaminopimelate ligase [Actinomycetota bacterium]|nr:UDP-N-acetylmuramoyl-L-alanyl-D-glutamate--2,6-diaminopimelate ligase [Actinomycetota bacterium]
MTGNVEAVPSPSGPPSPRPRSPVPRPLSAVSRHLGVSVTPASSGDPADVSVTGVTLDSRAVRPGDLYAALAGATAHGADFTAAARRAGGVAALTDPAGRERVTSAGLPALVVADPRAVLGGLAAWVYGQPADHLTTVGITGTNGKTTTAYLVEAGLRAAGRSTGLIGTIETRIGDQVVASVRTTPEAPELQALLAVMVEQDVQAVVMEVSSHALAMGRVDGTTYDVAVFTNLSEDHLDFHADLEDYFQVKATLFSRDRARRGVVDVDDEHGRRLVGQSAVPVVSVSPSGAAADWRVEDPALDRDRSTFTLVGPDGRRVSCSTALTGGFNLANAALAVVALAQVGIEPQVAADGVASCAGVPGRMERVSRAGSPGPLALVDYAHSPDALERLLAAVRPLAGPGRVLLVIGCGGDRDPYKRPVMGRIAARDADVAVLTNDNPRSEDPLAIIADMRRGADQVPGAVVEVQADRAAAIRRAVRLAGPGDVVVIAGKGHEQGQEVAGAVLPFDDRAVLRAELEAVSA